MIIKTLHHFKLIGYDHHALLAADVKTLPHFMRNLNKQSELYPDCFEPNDYKGDAAEAMVECLVNYSPIDPRINCKDYKPTAQGYRGVDGIGKTHHNEVH